MNNSDIFFKKTGKEIKSSLLNKKNELEIRLKVRKEKFDKFIHDPQKVAAFFMEESGLESEEREELWQIGRRVNEIENDLTKINMKLENLKDNEIYKLSCSELVESGFDLIG